MKFWHYWKWSNFVRCQPVTVADLSSTSPNFLPDKQSHFKRVLTLWDLLAYSISSTVGAGIFVTAGIASLDTGSALFGSFLIGAFASLLSALCYAEYVSRFPVSGSAYSFVYLSLGELVGWLVGWNMTLEYAVAASAVAQGWAGYFINFLQTVAPAMYIPPQLFNYPFVWGLTFSPLALGIIVVCSIISYFGIKQSSRVNQSMSALNLTLIVMIIIVGIVKFDRNNWDNFLGPEKSWNGFGGLLTGASTVFFSFIGFDSVTTLAGEVDNPGKVFPIAIAVSLALITLLYIGVSVVLCGMVTAATVNIEAPLSDAFYDVGLHWASTVVAVGSVTTLTASTLASLISQPRIFFQMAVDGLLFSPFSWVSDSGVLTFGITFTLILSGILALIFNIDSLSQMISAGTLLAYATVCAGIITLRYSEKENADRELHSDTDTTPDASYVPLYNPVAILIRKWINLVLVFYVVSSTIFGIAIASSWHVAVIATFGGLNLIIIIAVALVRPTDNPVTFTVPLTPLVPMLGVMVNVTLITALNAGAIIRVLIWSAAGVVIYLFYGVQHSALNKTSNEDTPVLGPDRSSTEDTKLDAAVVSLESS